MNVGTRKTVALFALILLARVAGAKGNGGPLWQESFTLAANEIGGQCGQQIEGGANRSKLARELDEAMRKASVAGAEAASMPDRPVLKTFEGFPEPACSKGYAL